jgi:hypothetical protein
MDIKDETLKILVKEASSSQRKQLKMLIGLMLALGGGGIVGGGAWMHSAGQQLDESSTSSAMRDDRLQRNEAAIAETVERVETIAILLVWQGRHFEDMVRSVAPRGAHLPERPTALDEIEQQVLRRRTGVVRNRP